jgi:hypothetical protein
LLVTLFYVTCTLITKSFENGNGLYAQPLVNIK